MSSSFDIPFSKEIASKIGGILFNSPREISGLALSAIEQTLSRYEGDDSATYIDKWYRGAGVANYDSTEAAAAYLAAYSPRSILRYQESVFALLMLKGAIPSRITVTDYGSGPAPAYAALMDLWSLLAQFTDQQLSLKYIALDRSAYMLEVAKDLCRNLQDRATINTDFELLHADATERLESDILLTSYMLNEGEGNNNCQETLALILSKIMTKDLIVIETASEETSRQMCSLAIAFPQMQHIGPCPSANSGCTEWTFRKFTKRVYPFERRALGRWSGAARWCKFSLSLLSSITNPRELSKSERVIVHQPSLTNRALTCRYGVKSPVRTFQGSPWDTIDSNSNVNKWWPQ
jgi:SAM-dependent methyltransferase